MSIACGHTQTPITTPPPADTLSVTTLPVATVVPAPGICATTWSLVPSGTSIAIVNGPTFVNALAGAISDNLAATSLISQIGVPECPI